MNGTTSLTGEGSRWGDYSALSVDPVDLVVSKSDSPDPVIAGNQLNYTINVVNTGSATATGVVATDTLPAGVTFLSSSIPCSGAGLIKTCALGSLAPGAGTSFTIQVRIPANFLSSAGVSSANITNTVTVTSVEADANPVNNTASADTNVIEQADVSVTKTCKPDSPAPAGSAAFCDIVVSNLGVSDAQNVTLTDTITSNSPFQVVSYGVTPPVTCAPAVPSAFVTSFTVTCNIGTLAAGASTTIRVNITSDTAGDVNDSATVSSSTPDPNTANNLATGRISFFSGADLSVTKSSSPNPVVAGTNVTYIITAANAGPSAAVNVVVTDTLPAQISVFTVTPGGGFQCSGGIPGNPAQPLICTLGTLNNGASAIITVVATVNPSTPQGTVLINNVAIRSDVNDGNNSNNVFTANTTVNARADLAIVKTSDKATYKPSSPIIYTVTVTNNGASDAQAVVVTDVMPDPKQALYQSNNGGCTLTAQKTLNCNLGTMAVGTSRSFQINMLVHGSKGNVSNTATVSSATTDPTPANNSSTRVVTIGK